MTRLIDIEDVSLLKTVGAGELSAKALWRRINRQPTIDAVPVRHGKWIDEGQPDDFFPHHAWRCSECGEQVLEIGEPWYKFCPACGARMDEERREENGI